jgi:hypothetical protein
VVPVPPLIMLPPVETLYQSIVEPEGAVADRVEVVALEQSTTSLPLGALGALGSDKVTSPIFV